LSSILHCDLPESQGVENAIKRARQLVELRWSPLSAMPKSNPKTFRGPDGRKLPGFFRAGEALSGLPYSSARTDGRFIMSDVSLDTFFSALENPDSVLYTHNLFGGAVDNCAPFYGIVCSAYVSWVLNLPFRTPHMMWPEMKQMRRLENDVDALKLCDTLRGPGHVAIVTGIARDDSGKVHRVVVSESVQPLCISTEFTTEEFIKKWFEEGKYQIYRYDADRLARIPYEPSPFVRLDGDPPPPARPERDPALALNWGDRVNLAPGREVMFSVREGGWRTLEVLRDGELHARIPLSGAPQRCMSGFAESGCYKARCLRENGEASRGLRFNVVGGKVRTDKARYRPGEPIEIEFSAFCAGDRPLYAVLVETTQYYSRRMRAISPEEAGAKRIILQHETPGSYFVKVAFDGEFGSYSAAGAPLVIQNG
jgi:hypothetical protein